MLQHTVRSPARTAALGKYLVAFANSQQQPDDGNGNSTDKKPSANPAKPSAKRRRLHILYILNDVLFHVKNRAPNRAFFTEIEAHLPALIKAASAFHNAPKHEKKLQDLVQLWDQQSYFTESTLENLRTAITAGLKSAGDDAGANGTDATLQQKPTGTSSSAAFRDAPYILPPTHGDPAIPWYDLPAANWLPFIEPNSTRPLNPSMIRPLQLAGGPADKGLVQAVKNLLGDVDRIYAKEAPSEDNGDATALDISPMGEVIERDEMGDIVSGETYYGWSKAFCEKMKARKKKGDAMDIDGIDDRGRRGSSRLSSRSRSRSRRRSRSRESSRPAMKRRRLSNSLSRSRSRHRDRSWSSDSRGGRRSRSGRRRSRGYSPSSRSRSRSARRSRSAGLHSPPPALGSGSNNQPNMQGNGFLPPPPPPPGNFHSLPNAPPHPLPNFPGPPPTGFVPPPPFDPWGNAAPPPPPPPPPHYQGHWPPPPPLPPQGLPQPMAHGWFPAAPNNNGAAPQPPPPPPQGALNMWQPTAGSWAPPPSATGPPQGYAYGGRGGGGAGSNGYRGRGGYGRGRGW